jgi:hypothetical protein
MRRLPTFLATLLISGSAVFAAHTPALAQAPAPAPAAPATVAQPAAPPSEEARKLATTLTDVIGVSRQSQQLIGIMRGQMIQMVMRTSSKPQDESTKIVDEVLLPDFTSQTAELNAQIVDVWASSFSTDELKGLLTFYNTPLGKKLIATLPAVTQQSMANSQAWGQRVYQAAIQKHADELRVRGLKL